ncbi:CarD family transcriptional regulator [Yeguia hominis]|uniref:CarD family transcriptional regulator n=1 Tax=Yeguia hominis TaxID=2763662 RepID=A0A926D8X1_9FIRM|nr:CarD family transcriptional regulator [Yeguia hominis]MBC8533396.1 CarD family transcriptional regulator [Yeguia hominis]
MFQTEEMVLYGHYGVCKIADIRTELFGREKKCYYVLKPIEDATTTLYCPVELGGKKFRQMLSRETICAMMDDLSECTDAWIAEDHARQEHFQEILRTGDQAQILRMYRMLYTHREHCRRTGRKFHAVDQKLMKEAEGMLCSEFSYVLQLRHDAVLPLLSGKTKLAEIRRACR